MHIYSNKPESRTDREQKLKVPEHTPIHQKNNQFSKAIIIIYIIIRQPRIHKHQNHYTHQYHTQVTETDLSLYAYNTKYKNIIFQYGRLTQCPNVASL